MCQSARSFPLMGDQSDWRKTRVGTRGSCCCWPTELIVAPLLPLYDRRTFSRNKKKIEGIHHHGGASKLCT